MKFGDKLIALRKKKGLSQEELAEKLSVSRQSVSKWESNNTYPETDKIVQICNIFECTMDDLINDNITDIESIERKSKNNINVMVDSFLDFITKTINMIKHFDAGQLTDGTLYTLGLERADYLAVIVGCLIVGIVGSMKEHGIPVQKKMGELAVPVRWGLYYALIIGILIFAAYGDGYQIQDLIYAGF